MRRLHPSSGILGDDLDVVIATRLDTDVGANADGGIERLSAVMKEVKGPDVHRSTGQIDTCRGRSRYSHAHIIIL